MRLNPSLIVAACSIVLAGPVAAQSADELLKSKGCLNCHAPDTKKIGPSFKDIAAKYKGDSAAVDKLVAALKAGKHPKVSASDAELKTMLTQVVATK